MPPPVVVPQELKTDVAGTFSAFGIGQMGPQSIPKQQLEELTRIREEMVKANAAGGVAP